MDITRKELNKIYYAVEIKANEITAGLRKRTFETKSGWYNGHYSKNEKGEYIKDHFPIPVIEIKGLCDIEIGFKEITISAKLKRETALTYSFEKIETPFEAYGVEDFLADYYNEGMSLNQLRENIRSSKEKEIGVSFLFEPEAEKVKIFDLVEFLRDEGFYY